MWLVGSHNMKFGSEYRYYIEDASRFSTAASPQINFSNTWTRGPLDNSSAAPFGQDFASFLLGLPTGGTMSRAAAYREKSSVLSFYAHDDWRVGSNLTLNLGVRWEIEEPLTEAEDRFVSGFDFTAAAADRGAAEAAYARNPIAEIPASQFRVRGGLLYPDTGGPSKAWERNMGNIMPRAGFAWLVTPQTSVRGGYGMFYDVLGTNRITVNQVGYSRDTPLTPSLDNGQTFIATLANPFPERSARTGRLRPRPDDERRPGRQRSRTSARSRIPRNHRWSLGLQRELPWQLLVEATYVGAQGAEPAGDAATERRAAAVPLDVARARRCDEQPADAAGAEPVRWAAAGTGLDRRNVARSQLLRPYPQFTSVQATRDERQVRLPRRCRRASSAAWRTASPCRSRTRGRGR